MAASAEATGTREPSSELLAGRLDCTSRVQPVTARVLVWLELEAADHAASTVRKQREMDAGAQLTFILFSSGPPAHRTVATTLMVHLLSSVNQVFKNWHRHTQQCCCCDSKSCQGANEDTPSCLCLL